MISCTTITLAFSIFTAHPFPGGDELNNVNDVFRVDCDRVSAFSLTNSYNRRSKGVGYAFWASRHYDLALKAAAVCLDGYPVDMIPTIGNTGVICGLGLNVGWEWLDVSVVPNPLRQSLVEVLTISIKHRF